MKKKESKNVIGKKEKVSKSKRYSKSKNVKRILWSKSVMDKKARKVGKCHRIINVKNIWLKKQHHYSN